MTVIRNCGYSHFGRSWYLFNSGLSCSWWLCTKFWKTRRNEHSEFSVQYKEPFLIVTWRRISRF